MGDEDTLQKCEGKLKEMVSANILDENYLMTSPISVFVTYKRLQTEHNVVEAVDFCFDYLDHLPISNIKVWFEYVTPFVVFDMLCTVFGLIQNSGKSTHSSNTVYTLERAIGRMQVSESEARE